MKLRLRATPIAAAAVPPAAAIASTSLSMVVLSVAVTVNVPAIGALSTPRSLSSIRAWLVPRMVLMLWAPPPERPTARSLAAAAAIATATEVAWILPVLPLVMATAPALPTPPKPLPSRRKPCSPAFCRRIRVLSASDSPTAGAAENWAAGATLTARAAPQAVVVRLLVSLALSVRSPLPRVRVAPSPAPSTSAVTFCLRVFVASEPAAPLAATPTDPLPVQAMAAEVAPTVASIVLVWSAFSVSDWATRDFTPA